MLRAAHLSCCIPHLDIAGSELQSDLVGCDTDGLGTICSDINLPDSAACCGCIQAAQPAELELNGHALPLSALDEHLTDATMHAAKSRSFASAHQVHYPN